MKINTFSLHFISMKCYFVAHRLSIKSFVIIALLRSFIEFVLSAIVLLYVNRFSGNTGRNRFLFDYVHFS